MRVDIVFEGSFVGSAASKTKEEDVGRESCAVSGLCVFSYIFTVVMLPRWLNAVAISKQGSAAQPHVEVESPWSRLERTPAV